MSTTHVKFVFGKDIRRLPFVRQTFAELCSALAQTFSIAPKSFLVKFLDEDDDLVTVSSDRELEESIRYFSEQGQTLRFFIQTSTCANVLARRALASDLRLVLSRRSSQQRTPTTTGWTLRKARANQRDFRADRDYRSSLLKALSTSSTTSKLQLTAKPTDWTLERVRANYLLRKNAQDAETTEPNYDPCGVYECTLNFPSTASPTNISFKRHRTTTTIPNLHSTLLSEIAAGCHLHPTAKPIGCTLQRVSANQRSFRSARARQAKLRSEIVTGCHLRRRAMPTGWTLPRVRANYHSFRAIRAAKLNKSKLFSEIVTGYQLHRTASPIGWTLQRARLNQCDFRASRATKQEKCKLLSQIRATSYQLRRTATPTGWTLQRARANQRYFRANRAVKLKNKYKLISEITTDCPLLRRRAAPTGWTLQRIRANQHDFRVNRAAGLEHKSKLLFEINAGQKLKKRKMVSVQLQRTTIPTDCTLGKVGATRQSATIATFQAKYSKQQAILDTMGCVVADLARGVQVQRVVQ